MARLAVELLHQGALLAWSAVALRHAVELVALRQCGRWCSPGGTAAPSRAAGRRPICCRWLSCWPVAVLAGGRTAARGRAGDLVRAWPVVFARRHCWPGRRSHCCTWSSCWPAADLLPVAELVARLAVELLHLARIGGRWSAVAPLHLVELVSWLAVALRHLVELAWPAVALLHLVELVVRLAVELLRLVRIGGRWWLSCSTRRHCWPGRRPHCRTWSSWCPGRRSRRWQFLSCWPVADLLPAAVLACGRSAAGG